MHHTNVCHQYCQLLLLASASKRYYPRTLLEECEYEIKKAKIENFIDDYLGTSSSVDETDSETEYDNDE